MKHARIALTLSLLIPGWAAAQGLKVSPASLSFQHTLGSATFPAAQSLAVSPSGGTAVTFAATVSGGAWLTVSPDNAKTNATLKVKVNPTSLPAGTYSANVVLTPTGGTAQNVLVTLSVKAPPATLVATPSPVTMSYTRGAPAPAPVALNLSGGGALLSFSITVTGATWLSVTPKSNVIFPAFSSQVAVIVDPTGLTPGVYRGTLKIDAPAAANKTQSVDVVLTVNAGPPALTSIFPTGVTQGSPATVITLSGTNFYTASVVTANSTTLPVTLLGPTALQATIPASLLATAGTPLSITVSNPNPGGGTSPAQSFTVYPPGPRISSVANGASFLPGPVAPGEFVNIFGSGLGPDTVVTFQPPTGTAPIANTLAGVQVFFDSTPAPLLFVSATQIAAMAPYAVVGTSVVITVTYNAATSPSFTALTAATSPALFALGASGSGPGAVFNVNETTGELTLNTETNQVVKGASIWLFATGAGVTVPAGGDGVIATAEAALTTPSVALKIGGVDVVPDYAGPSPGLVSGLLLIKAKVPANVAAGRAVPVSINIGGVDSQPGVTIAVK